MTDFFSGTGYRVIDIIVVIFVFICVARRIWTDMRKEIDIAHGLDPRVVRKYYRKMFHSRAQKEAYLREQAEARADAFGCGADSGDRHINALKPKKRDEE